MVPMMLAMQGALFDENGRAQFATPEAVEAVNYVVDLIKSGFMPEQSINWTVDDVYEQFAADRLAMIQAPACVFARQRLAPIMSASCFTPAPRARLPTPPP